MTTNHLILLPGLMSDAEVWAEQASALSGLTDCEVPDYGLCDSLAGMAQQVLAGTSAATFALAGHSMGGRVALEVLRQAPERVQRLALLDTGIHPLAPGEAGEKSMLVGWHWLNWHSSGHAGHGRPMGARHGASRMCWAVRCLSAFWTCWRAAVRRSLPRKSMPC